MHAFKETVDKIRNEMKRKFKIEILRQKKSEKFLLMNPFVAFNNNYKFIAFAPTERKAKDEAIIIKRDHFPIVIDVRFFFSTK